MRSDVEATRLGHGQHARRKRGRSGTAAEHHDAVSGSGEAAGAERSSGWLWLAGWVGAGRPLK